MSQGFTQEETKILNSALFEKLASDDPSLVKEGAADVQDYTRTTLREEGIHRNIQPYVPVTDDDLDRSITHGKLRIIEELQPDSPAAMSVGFATLPQNLYINTRNYETLFDRIQTRKFTKDVDELRATRMDLRQVISDQSILDIQAEEDGKYLRAVNSALVGAGATVAQTGVVQHSLISGQINRVNLWDSLKVMPNTPYNLSTKTILINNISINDLGKFDHDEMGDGRSGEVFRKGWTLEEFLGKKWVVTMKKGLVPTNTMYHFADHSYIGKAYELYGPTMALKRENIWIEWFVYEMIGASIGNIAGLARIDFNAA